MSRWCTRPVRRLSMRRTRPKRNKNRSAIATETVSSRIVPLAAVGVNGRSGRRVGEREVDVGRRDLGRLSNASVKRKIAYSPALSQSINLSELGVERQ